MLPNQSYDEQLIKMNKQGHTQFQQYNLCGVHKKHRARTQCSTVKNIYRKNIPFTTLSITLHFTEKVHKNCISINLDDI